MKTIMGFKKLLLTLSVLFYLETIGQYPAAQGPPGVTPGPEKVRELPASVFTETIKTILRDSIIPMVNAAIREEGPPVKVVVSSTLQPGTPRMTVTKNTNRPNQKIIEIPCKLDYKLDINGFPDRHIYQNVVINIFCEDWYTYADGKANVRIVADKAFLGGPSFNEQAINFFLGNWLTPLIDNSIRSNLPDKFSRKLSLEGLQDKCNCLGLHKYSSTDYWIQWQYKNPPARESIPGDATNFNTITVKIDSIRRLNARNFETGEVLYEPSEDINILLYANHGVQTLDVNSIREGESRKLPANNITIPKPKADGSLILIANISQKNNRSDSKFITFYSRQNFGNGSRKLIVRKSFYAKPVKLPGGGMSKPQKMFREAYELIISINTHIPVAH
ncbi:MAG TPA: hypothetical protein VK492_01480 [Chitinophagaceae bacterium]|nr:hypothetical protein [Chitinophagaceae bacterium]